MLSAILLAALVGQTAPHAYDRTEREFARHSLGGDLSVVTTWSDLRPFDPRIAVRIVHHSGPVVQTLEEFPVPLGHEDTPEFEFFGAHLYIHWFSDSIYRTTWKYPFDTSSLRAGPRIGFHRAAFRDPAPEPGAIVFYAESRDRSWNARVTPTEPRGFDYRATGKRQFEDRHRPDPVDLPSGERIWIRDDPERAGRYGVLWTNPRGREEFYPLPEPPLEFRRKPVCESDEVVMMPFVRHFAMRGGKIWFAPSFNAEGCDSGVGAIFSFDVFERKYQSAYPPPLHCCSASALAIENETIWIGLATGTSESADGRGLAAYDTKTGGVTLYPQLPLIHGIGFAGGRVYAGTTHGLWELDRKQRRLVQLRLEPDKKGWMRVIEKTFAL